MLNAEAVEQLRVLREFPGCAAGSACRTRKIWNLREAKKQYGNGTKACELIRLQRTFSPFSLGFGTRDYQCTPHYSTDDVVVVVECGITT